MNLFVYHGMHPLLAVLVGQEEGAGGGECSEDGGTEAVVEGKQPLLSVYLAQHHQHRGARPSHLGATPYFVQVK